MAAFISNSNSLYLCESLDGCPEGGKNAACVELNDEWSEEEKTLHLISKGFCIQNALAEYIENRRV